MITNFLIEIIFTVVKKDTNGFTRERNEVRIENEHGFLSHRYISHSNFFRRYLLSKPRIIVIAIIILTRDKIIVVIII
jgi:hypothetical protein